MSAAIFDPRQCRLGEGPLWHPERAQLFWFDILAMKLLTVEEGEPREWQFDEHVSAAGWIDADTLLIASETQLFSFQLDTGESTYLVPLEADSPDTRSNDGRADPMGGFWIGTMSKTEKRGAGAIYRYYRGEIRKLFGDITVSNSICFAPGGRLAYWADTPTRKIMKVALDAQGWPCAAPEVFVDLGEDRRLPDGSVVDSEGGLWNAQWRSSRIARYLPDGSFDRAIEVGGTQSTCPAFGGEGLGTLFCTSASVNLDDSDPAQGVTFEAPAGVTGLPEPQVIP